MNTIRMIFLDSQGRVRWGYKFLSLVLILELILPVLLILTGSLSMAAALPILQDKGIVDSAGMIAGEYQEAADHIWMIVLLSQQNILLAALCLLFGRLFLKKKPAQLGFKGGAATSFKEIGIGLGIGAAMLFASTILILVSGAAVIRPSGESGLAVWLAGYFVLFVLVGFGEETAFRGYAIGAMEQTENTPLICCFTGLVFGLAHSANNNFSMMGFLNISLVGIFLALLVMKTGRLWLAVGFHIAWNFAQGCLAGFPVSGMGTKSLFVMELTGNELLSGGSFGAEGSIWATAVILLGIGAVCWYGRRMERAAQKEA